MSLRVSVQAALDAQPPESRDAAVTELALTYARLMDDAAPAAKYAKALGWLESGADSEDARASEHTHTIVTALSRHTVASDLGPKLLAALEALRMSPRARAAAMKGGKDDKPTGRLDQLADRRARKGRAETVDAAAP
jgi:hypothetical protein